MYVTKRMDIVGYKVLKAAVESKTCAISVRIHKTMFACQDGLAVEEMESVFVNLTIICVMDTMIVIMVLMSYGVNIAIANAINLNSSVQVVDVSPHIGFVMVL